MKRYGQIIGVKPEHFEEYEWIKLFDVYLWVKKNG